MRIHLQYIVVVNLIVLPTIIMLPSSKKQFAIRVCASCTAEEKQLLHKLLLLFRDYCSYEKELIEKCYMPEQIQQEISQKMLQKQTEINAIFTAQNDNTCFINKMIHGMKVFDLYLEQDKIKTIDILLEELHKK